MDGHRVQPDYYPLSPIQQGMLFHWLRDRHSGTDIEQIVADLQEPIERERFEAAWNAVIDRFATLRTAFAWEGLERPMQRIEPQAPLRVTFTDLRGFARADREQRVADYLKDDRREGFDLGIAPAMRVRLFQTGDRRFTMVWTFHHILIDGRAFELILNGVFAAYETGSAPAVADRPYREYIDWVEAQDATESRNFWRAALAGYTAPTPLPFDPSASRSPEFGEQEAELSAVDTRRLRELATREQVSLNTVVMAAWALLLARYSGERDIVFGATKTTRRGTIPDADSMVGLFLATIPVRVSVDPDAPAAEWLKAVRAAWVSLRGHEHLPLVEIRQQSVLPPGAAFFESLVVFENYRFATRLRAQGGAWSTRDFRLHENTGFPLTFLVYGDEALALKIEFDGSRYAPETVERLLGELSRILTAWATSPAALVWETPVTTRDEEQRLLEAWNATELIYPRDQPLAQLIEAQVARTPDAIAVVFGAEQVSYSELNRRANLLARELVRLGAGPDRLIGICLERSTAMMVALLAVAKAGAAYMPIDPFLPLARMTYMVSDAEPVALITQESLRQQVSFFPGPVISIDSPAEATVRHGDDEANLGVQVQPNHLAYVIYTSGSTGKPKGVQISRGSLLNLLWSMREWLGLGAGDRVLAVTTISFDIAGVDIWLPWLVGACTVVADRQQAADGEQLRALLERHRITFLQATPVTWRLLIGAGWTGSADLQIVCTGEAMPVDLAQALAPMVGRLWNLYGPTETTIWSTGYRVEPATESVLIGRPVGNTQCYILDEHRRPVPLGAIGELFIAGDGLARGYLNRPELTAERFVPNPFRAGKNMYRTGDVARYRADGNIECLGRTDDQVKIRGFRIELGEIESVLERHAGVKQAVVIAREDSPGDKRLVAYVVPSNEPVEGNTLRVHAKESLPEYMVPAAFVSLDTMPLTPNGKVDKKALPAPDQGATVTGRRAILARTYVEKQLSEIWEEVFSLSQVSVEDDFFELGGHSLLALSMMSKIARVFGEQLPLNTLFESPTIEQLAKHIEQHQKTAGQHTLVSIQASGSRPPVFWIPGGAALGLFRLRHIVTRLGRDQPVYGLGSGYPKSLADVEGVEQRASHYLELVREVQPHGPYCLAGFCAGGRVAYEMAQRLVSSGESVAFLGMINCWYPNYPSGRVRRAVMKAQRLWHRIGEARAQGTGVLGLIRKRRAAQQQAQAEREAMAAARSSIATGGFQQGDRSQNEVLLEATTAKFEQYVPRPYPGRVSLFISDDAAVAGVSRNLDPRFAWARYAADHEVRVFPGGHQAVLEMPYAISFAETLKAALEDALP